MESLEYWRLCDQLSVYQAALLIVGTDPDGWGGPIHGSKPPGYCAVMTALSDAIATGKLPASIQIDVIEASDIAGAEKSLSTVQVTANDLAGPPTWEEVRDGKAKQRGMGELNPDYTTVQVSDLRDWLATRGFTTGFFFPQPTVSVEFLDPRHPRYAPKLAAAVQAWVAVEDTQGKTPKQALTKWLREHSAEFELSDEDGKPNETGIDECAKVANWRGGGGAPKTPG